MAFVETIELASPTGATLALYRQLSANPLGVLRIDHGLAEHAARYGRFFEMMTAQGFHVYAHDHRGHGRTRAPGAPLGHFNADADTVVADVQAVHDHLASAHPGLPVIAFGHSMGGLIALNHAIAHSRHLAGLAVWNANFSAGASGRAAQTVLAWERFRLGSDVPSRILPKLTFAAWGKSVSGRATEFDWLSRDPDEVAKYVADPLCGFAPSVGTWRTVFELIFRGADARRLAAMRRDLPIHLVGGAKDPATDGGRVVRALASRLRQLGFSNLVSTIYDETRHESLNELNRDAITADFAAWARRVVA